MYYLGPFRNLSYSFLCIHLIVLDRKTPQERFNKHPKALYVCGEFCTVGVRATPEHILKNLIKIKTV